MDSAAKKSVFCTMEEDIRAIAKSPEEAERIRALMLEAERQSQEKKIRVTRKSDLLKRHLDLLKVYVQYGIHWKKRFYPFRLARNILLGAFYNLTNRKKYVLRGIEFAVTFVCNFRCNHCLCARINETGKRREMTPSDYARVVKEAMALGATTFGLEGGEPFIFKGWESVIEACQPWKNHIIISTNGFLFDEKKARRCAELGVDTINFSLDSGIPELHDAFRRQAGSFKRVVEGIGLCKKYGINPLINTVVHKGNLYTDGFIQLLEFAEKEKVLINTLLAKGVGNFKDKDAVLSPEDLSNYQQIVRPYHYVRRHLAFNYAGKFGCPGTKEMINMTPYGDVMNCANMHIYFGNVMEEPLAVIRERAIRNSPFGLYHACFLADDVDFMKIYYPILEQQGSVDLDTFMNGLRDYEHHTGKKLYGGLSQRCSECQGI